MDDKAAAEDVDQPDRNVNNKNKSILQSLLIFRRVGVWLPYLLNQSGSILYYKLLATSDLSLSVPVCMH